MAGWPANTDHSDANRLRDTTPNPNTIFVSPTRTRQRYHSEPCCPHVSAGFYVLTPEDSRYQSYTDELEKCLWCRYDANDTLDLD